MNLCKLGDKLFIKLTIGGILLALGWYEKENRTVDGVLLLQQTSP